MRKLPGKYKTYSPEFRDEAARLVVELGLYGQPLWLEYKQVMLNGRTE